MPPFDYYYHKQLGDTERRTNLTDPAMTTRRAFAWRVVAADFVTTDSGTGIVHHAPAFGEVDYRRLASTSKRRFVDGEGPQLINCRRSRRQVHRRRPRVLPRPLGQRLRQGHHPRSEAARPAVSSRAIPPRLSVLLAGRRRSADPVSARELVHPHDRSSRTRCSRTTRKINWLPEHIKDGRFGNFLESNVDWALSRERYWGTPLPIWVCERDRQDGSGRQLRRAAGQARRHRHRSLGRSEEDESRAARRPEGPQAVHRRGHLRLAVRQGRAHAARHRGDRLLVRLRRDAVRPMGLSRTPRAATSVSNRSSRPTSSAKRSTKPAAGSTANWRSARCCLGRSEERGARSENKTFAPRSSLLAPILTRSATASSSA